MKRNLLNAGITLVIYILFSYACQPLIAGSQENKQFKINKDGTVQAGGHKFYDMQHYTDSDYFRETGKRCGTSQRMQARYGNLDPQEENKSTSHCTTSTTSIQSEYWPASTYTVNIVFHIIHMTNGTGNISDQKINDQVTVLNEDFRAKAGTMGSSGFDTKIQFSLAGITRTANDTWHNDSQEATYKAALGWDQNRYLNVYVNTAGGYLGYAYFPQSSAGSVYDGVVILYNSVGGRNNGYGSYDQGRTLVHEIGHYFGLHHTFNGGCGTGYSAGDLISDTNAESTEHYGCSQTSTCSSSDPIHNYMNYTDDTCMTEFTSEQANRAVCGLVNYRPLIKTTPPSSPTLTVTSPNGGETLTGGAGHTVTWSSTGSVGNVKIEYSTDSLSTWNSVTASTANDGSYAWTVPELNSGKCYVRVSEASDSSPSDTSNHKFTITDSGTNTLTLSSPNGGETFSGGSGHTITWISTGTVGNVKLEYSNGGLWSTITSSTANDGSYSWSVPNSATSQGKIKISEAADGSPADTSDSTFNITVTTTAGLTLTSPNGGETLTGGGSHSITWTSTGDPGNVKLEYSTDTLNTFTTIVSSTGNTGSYVWTVPNENSKKCYVRISQVSGGTLSDTSNHKFTITSVPPEISVNRTTLKFGGNSSGRTTDAQKILIRNSGGQTLNWTAASNASWLTISPSSGTGDALVTVSVTNSGLSSGNYSGAIMVTDPNASNQGQITVTLTLYNNGASSAPFGEVATPDNNAVVSSSVPVTGWVLDDIGVESVAIFNGNSYIGDAVFVEGARPDVESSYPQYPNHYKAGWGYMLLTHFLPNGGNGTYTIYARATDKEGQTVTLGSRTIMVDNANAFKPFGAIDTPAPGGTASGSKFINWGWALTPPPAAIPTDGSTINVYVDGVNLGHPVYNINRSDIASLFPDYANSDGAAGYFYLDTTAYDYGVHTIQWVVKDNDGQSDGIGSRYFIIEPSNRQGSSSAPKGNNTASRNLKRLALSKITGSKEIPKRETIVIDARETGRIEFQLPGKGLTAALSPLPVGSSLDSETGIFRWHLGVGFNGIYTLRFALIDSHGLPAIQELTVNVAPKF